jgi:hypothetical protein
VLHDGCFANSTAGWTVLREPRIPVNYKDLPNYCRIAARLKPSDDSDIRIELWLPPASTWNGKFMRIGNGGWVFSQEMGLPLTRGYAVAAHGQR